MSPGLHLSTAIREQSNLPHADGLPGSKEERGHIGLQPASCTSPYVQQHTKTGKQSISSTSDYILISFLTHSSPEVHM